MNVTLEDLQGYSVLLWLLIIWGIPVLHLVLNDRERK